MKTIRDGQAKIQFIEEVTVQNPQNPYSTPPIADPSVPTPYNQNLAPGGNSSGMGAQSVLPDELKGLNWGAFLMNWIWSIAHSSWIGLLALVPYIGFIMCLVLLFKGNEFAWQNRKWDSIEQFREVQGKWTMWGIIIFVAGVVLSFVFMALVASLARNNPSAFTPSTVPSR